MSPVNELLNQFIKVIVDYHDYQIQKQTDFNQLIKLDNEMLKSRLNDLIDTMSKDYPKREIFYKFLAHRVYELKLLINRNAVLSDEETNTVQTKLQDLLESCHNLLNTKDSKENAIKTQDGFEINGFSQGGYFNAYCRTGQLIKKVLDERQIPSPTSKGEKLFTKVSELIVQHQKILLKPLEKQKAIELLEQRCKKLQDENSKLETECNNLYEEKNELETENKKLRNQISQYTQNNTGFNPTGYLFSFFPSTQISNTPVSNPLPGDDEFGIYID